MKKVILLMIIGLTTTTAFGQKKETRSVSDFTGINASSVFDITVTKGNTESLTIEADDDAMPYVRSEVRNGILRLYLDNSNRELRNIKILKASVVMKNLENVTLSGVCKFTANDLFTPNRFKADCSGVSNLAVNLNTGEMRIEASGASKIRIIANITGNASLGISGVSKIQSELKASDVKLNSSGASSIELTGSAANFKIDVSGSSKINAEDFTVKNAVVESSGTSKITVNVTDALKISSSGTSSINYKGSPVTDINSSRAVKVRKM